ncbi:hypothetical protein FA13DRAFT_1720561 [Coprinellus micaceus]|uniref:Uncharacterized protein n=1 Tax=Coprinellus micaceus TaxID=71717 RepID=A0A4Y7S8L4_COPMI|nr:hypothetical protein FA13DRAFT_1720561 [Coprinellus micaceus]
MSAATSSDKKNHPPISWTSGMLKKCPLGELSSQNGNPEVFTRAPRKHEQSEHKVYQALMELVPGLKERLNTMSNNKLIYIADMLTKWVFYTRSDDTKTLKAAVIDWITPTKGYLSPPLSQNVKTDRGNFHDRTGELLCPVNLDWNNEKIRRDLKSGQLVPLGDLWPRFIYQGYQYDPENPWDGLLHSAILVNVYKHVFTSPSSVGQTINANRATRSRNARLHGMKFVTVASVAYIATQVCFSPSSMSDFSHADTVMDSEYFYQLIVDLLDDPEEAEEVDHLLKWWNQSSLFKFPSTAIPFINIWSSRGLRSVAD